MNSRKAWVRVLFTDRTWEDMTCEVSAHFADAFEDYKDSTAADWAAHRIGKDAEAIIGTRCQAARFLGWATPATIAQAGARDVSEVSQ